MEQQSPIVKRIVVLANSFKYHGRCVAGREVLEEDDGRLTFGGWVRPVSDREHGELDLEHCRLQDGQPLQLLDIVDVPCTRPQCDPTQPENWVVDQTSRWRRVGRLNPIHLPDLAEQPDELWLEPGNHTDRITAGSIASAPPQQSLYLLHLQDCRVVMDQLKQLRLRFAYGGTQYALRITDPDFETRYESRLIGREELPLGETFVCVSLGIPFNGHHYKLAAAVMPVMTGVPLFTIGHSNLSSEAFVGLLKRHQIDAIADVRSQPYSSRYPHFSRDALQGTLKSAGIHYVYLGLELGARRDEPECYVNGQAKYERITGLPAFKSGVRRVISGAAKHRIALMCAEKDPLTCHRAILVCRHLWPFGFDIHHILEDGQVETQAEAEQRLMAEEKRNPNQIGMFSFDDARGSANPLERAYASRGDKIAYRRDEGYG